MLIMPAAQQEQNWFDNPKQTIESFSPVNGKKIAGDFSDHKRKL